MTPPPSGRGGDAADTFVIAIDGPAASGKSSTAQWVAEELGFLHIDSGALYRAATAVRLREGGTPEEWTEASLLRAVRDITVEVHGMSFVPLGGGRTLEPGIRGSEVTRAVSHVARMPGVRAWVNERVRELAQRRRVVIDGRDIGSIVFPDAQLKIYLIADPWERARRRLLQRLGRRPTDEEIAEETDRLVHRDARDATQSVQASDAVLIDTTYLTQADQVARIVALAKAVTQRPDDTSVVDA